MGMIAHPRCAAARQLWHDEGWVFATPTGLPLSPNTDYHEWKQLLALAEVRGARLHDARHTAATVLLILGVPVRTVMSLMGWSTAEMAARYQHVTDTIRQQVARQVDGIIWQAWDESDAGGIVSVSRDVLAAILPLAEVGLAHGDVMALTGAHEAVAQLRAVLSRESDKPGWDATTTRGGRIETTFETTRGSDGHERS